MSEVTTNSTSSNNTIYDINRQNLCDAECKSYANNLLNCFAAVRNEWSSYEDLAHFFKILKPWMTRPPLKNIKENICDWNRKSKNEGLGDEHNEKGECTITGIHRVCKKVDTEGNEFFRIHPTFADTVFVESNHTIDDIKPLPIRMTKRKRDEEEQQCEPLAGDDEMERKIRSQIAMHKKIMRRLKNKIEEARKLQAEYNDSMNALDELEEEMKNYSKHTLQKAGVKSGGGSKVSKKRRVSHSEEEENIEEAEISEDEEALEFDNDLLDDDLE